MTDSGQDQYLTTVEEEQDDLDLLLEGELSDPEFRGAYEDASLRERLLRDLLNARIASHLTQTAVAQRMGTTQSAISEIEGGATDPRLSTLQRYARAVGNRLAAWVVPEDAQSDHVFHAFVTSESAYLMKPSQYYPDAVTTLFCGHVSRMHVVAVAPFAQQGMVYFAGRIGPITLPWEVSTMEDDIGDIKVLHSITTT